MVCILEHTCKLHAKQMQTTMPIVNTFKGLGVNYTRQNHWLHLLACLLISKHQFGFLSYELQSCDIQNPITFKILGLSGFVSQFVSCITLLFLYKLLCTHGECFPVISNEMDTLKISPHTYTSSGITNIYCLHSLMVLFLLDHGLIWTV